MNYSREVIVHFERPRNLAGEPLHGECSGRAGEMRRGSVVEFHGKLENGRLEGLKFSAWGCPCTIAVASWLTEELEGKPLGAILPLSVDDIAAALGVPAEKWHCILTAEDALRDLLEENQS